MSSSVSFQRRPRFFQQNAPPDVSKGITLVPAGRAPRRRFAPIPGIFLAANYPEPGEKHPFFQKMEKKRWGSPVGALFVFSKSRRGADPRI